MKLRTIPEDFDVSEAIDRQPTGGPFALYRLRKKSIGTLEALALIRRHWNLTAAQVSHAGLKDRHAVTSQYITIKGGPDADFEHDICDLTYVGQTATSLTAGDIVRNDFAIVLRSLTADDVRAFETAGQQVAASGFANYFDTQRFGSLGESQKFVAAAWCMKDYEQALWLALAEHNAHDDAEERAQKLILRDHWNDWPECKQRLDRSHRRSVVTYLADHPDKYKKAFALVNAELRGLYLSAFQSAVWNRMLSHVIEQNCEPAFSLQIADCNVHVPPTELNLDEEHAAMPLPSVRCKNLSAAMRSLCDQSLEPYEMNLRQMKVHFPRDRWFSRAVRKAIVVPGDLRLESDNDEINSGRHKLTMRFGLPRGCYATMLLKAVLGPQDEVLV